MRSDYTDRLLEEWATARPDVDASSAAVVNRVLRLARYLENALNAVAADHGLSHKGDFDTLAALRRRRPEQQLSPTRLADAALITTGGMTTRLDRLERAGYVERRADPDDRRALLVRLTETGQTIVDKIFEANLEIQRESLRSIDPAQRATLAESLKTLLVDSGDRAT